MTRSARRRMRPSRRRQAISSAISPPGRDMPGGAQNVMELWRPFIEQQAGGTLDST